MAFVQENLRLAELVSVANKNKEYFEYFLHCLVQSGFRDLWSFSKAPDDQALEFFQKFMSGGFPTKAVLYDGVFSPYPAAKARWLLIGWIFRDAPQQRLKPLLKHANGTTAIDKQASLLNVVRHQCAAIFPEKDAWTWQVIREVIINRLEGSRRAKKGSLFEVIVRELLSDVIKKFDLDIEIAKSETRLGNETYDVSVSGRNGTLLIPVKTRKTMGGGHAHIFTRDIRESIARAVDAGYSVFPIIIAESWSGNLDDLATENKIFIQMNPNQPLDIKPLLRKELEKKRQILQDIS